MTEISMLSDNELIALSRAGQASAEEALAARYTQLVRICARPFFLVGGDSEDLLQEGMIGLLSAIRGFDPDMRVSFRSYANQCIRNRIIAAVTSATRQKHTPLNSGISFEYLLHEGLESLHSSYLDAFNRLTEEQVLAREREEEILVDNTKQLSRFEQEILEMYLQGLSCKEMANRVDRPEKSIDNAVQRIRKKIMRDS